MKNNQKKLYMIEIFLILILFFALFASRIINRQVLSVIMVLYLLFVYRVFKKKEILSIYKKQVTLLMILFAGLYVGAFYLMGLYFGFVRSKVLFSLWAVGRFIIPLSVIIVSSELIRHKFLSQKEKVEIYGKQVNISIVLTYVAMVLLDLVIYTGVYDLSNIDDFLKALGFVLFASLSCNLLYNYISIRFGSRGIIIYRLITVLYVYLIPITPNVYLFFRTFLRMVYPYLIYVVLEWSFARSSFAIAYADKKKSFIGTTAVLVVVMLMIALVSCKFTYGVLVVGSRSMSETINKGDVVVYESYKNQRINVGDILVFEKEGVRTIHRVVEIQDYNGLIRYFTKGDANSRNDDGYITKDSIYGIVKMKLKYVGYPTLWVRSFFE